MVLCKVGIGFRELHIVISSSMRMSSETSAHSRPATRPRVTVLDSELPLRDLPKLYKAADAFVLPSRGEGWGRPHVEAMAMGLPVIATNWSGPTAYLDNTVGYPLKYTLQPVDASLNLPGHNWAEPDVDHLRKLMRRLVMRPEEGRAKGVGGEQPHRSAIGHQ